MSYSTQGPRESLGKSLTLKGETNRLGSGRNRSSGSGGIDDGLAGEWLHHCGRAVRGQFTGSWGRQSSRMN
ncbi:hypothetical protein NL676_036284 [Syzygium grande]|nr:hypothetical protein NL676_036284 [Syzygium grande]